MKVSQTKKIVLRPLERYFFDLGLTIPIFENRGSTAFFTTTAFGVSAFAYQIAINDTKQAKKKSDLLKVAYLILTPYKYLIVYFFGILLLLYLLIKLLKINSANIILFFCL